MLEDRFDLLQNTFSECAPLFRDTTLPISILKRYKVGLFLREPTYCDASYKIGGFVAPHRFLIISSNARCLDTIAPTPWGLCVWQRGRVFKIIDYIEQAAYTQITLLEVPENLLDFFCNSELNSLEQSFVIQSRETFYQCIEMSPLPELNTNEWRERLVYPIGIDDEGGYFTLFSEEALQSNEMIPLIRDVLHYQAKIHLSSNDYTETVPLLNQALAVSPRTDTNKEATGSILLTLADVYCEISDLKKAETTLLEAFKLFKQLPDEENRLAVAATHCRLGHVYQMKGALLEAEQNYLYALKIRRRVEEPQSTVGLLVSLGALYERKEEFDNAQTFLDEAFKISSDEHGECHDVILLNNTARLAYKKGEYEKAISYFRRALLLVRNKQPVDLKQQATLLYNLAESLAAS
jgi:tetratricopeptide (TPR) repeat protein